MLSATASRNSMLRPKKLSRPCISSMKEPSATEIKKTLTSQEMVLMGREQSQRKAKPPKSTRCVHLSIKGTSTWGISFPGVKQAIKISKVHNIAKNLACFL